MSLTNNTYAEIISILLSFDKAILMTFLHTLKKRTSDVTIAFKSALDKLAEQANIDPYKVIFTLDLS